MHVHRILPVAGLLLALPAAAYGVEYSFTNIADTTGPYSQFYIGPVINDVGTVAFTASLDDGGFGIFTSSGGATTTIADAEGAFHQMSLGGINNDGTVAFHAGHDNNSGSGIYSGNGTTITTIAESGDQFVGFGYITDINDAGTVAFATALAHGVYTGNGGPLTAIPTEDGPFKTFGTGSVSINSNGTVAFQAADGMGNRGVYTGSGGPIATIATEEDGISQLPYLPKINDSGTVAFDATLEDGTMGIFTGDGGGFTTIVDTSGPFIDLYAPSINDHGMVAFHGTLESGDYGIFLGPDPVADRLIGLGDTLFGSTVTAAFTHRGLNDDGDVAFHYRLENGVTGIAVATVIPEPATAGLLGLLGAGLLARRRT